MLVTGYRVSADFNAVAEALSKHMNISKTDAKIICSNIQDGQEIKLPNDFVLREDLEDIGIFL